jgi:Zinc finger, C2H2 type
MLQWMSNNSGSHIDSHQTPCTASKSEASGSETKKIQRRRRHGDDDEKTFVCQYESCDKAFYRKDHLVRHQRQKHGKPFNSDTKLVYYCHDPECGQMFYQVSRLRRHVEECHPNLGWYLCCKAQGKNM